MPLYLLHNICYFFYSQQNRTETNGAVNQTQEAATRSAANWP